MNGRISPQLMALLLISVIVMSVCASCAAAAPAPAQETAAEAAAPANAFVPLRLAGWTEPSDVEPEIYRRCGVSYEYNDDYWVWLSAMFAKGTAPDIFLIDTSHLGSFLHQGFIRPIDESAGLRRDEFFDPAVNAFTFQGTTYGIPREFYTLALYYNRDLFAQAGMPEPTNDWNWDNLRDAAQVIRNATGVPGFALTPWSYQFGAFVFQNGGRIMAEDFSDTLIDAWPAIEAGNFLANARMESWAETLANLGVSGPRDALVDGRVAMILDGSWLLRDLTSSSSFGAVQPPAGYAAEGSLLFADGYAVSANSSAPQAAMDAIACLTSEESQTQLIESGVGGFPTRQSLEGHSQIQGNPAIYAAFTGAWFATPYNWGPYHQMVDATIQQALERVYDGSMTVEESFAQAANEIRKIIASQ